MFAQTPVYEVTDIYGINATTGATTSSPAADLPLLVVYGEMVPAVVSDPTDIMYTVPAGGRYRFDLISAQFYGVPDLWWVIAIVNNVIDPLLAIPPGTLIRVPSRDRLASEGVLNV
jgi:nucleoid-associated protein YgaU